MREDNALDIDAREKLEEDVRVWTDYWDSLTEDGSESLGHAKVREWLDRQAAVTANELSSRSDARKTAETAETVAAECEILDFDDSREKLAKEDA